jgi:branched-chain amino acid transport system permease protein
MIGVLASVIDGVLVGSVYGLAAMGLTLIWGVMRVINLTHGAMIVLGMFIIYFLVQTTGMVPYAGIPVVVVAAFAVGVAIYWIAVDRMIGRPILMSLLATFACNMILIGAGTAAWTTSPYNIPMSLPGISWQGYTFTGTHMMAAVCAGLIAVLLYLFLNYARYGKAIRAVASNREAAQLAGNPTPQVLAVTFGVGVALACAAGALIATLFPFTVLSGANYQLKSFVVTVLGGLGNPAGALLGGIALGLVEGLATPFMPVSWTPIIEFALFVVVLLAFPRGIFALSRA